MAGWYPDPTGRFEYRYHNDRHWTADVSTNGQRYVDPLPAPVAGRADTIAGPAATPPQDGGGNGVAIASMVCGIVALVIAWLPFVGVIGLVAAVVGLGLAIPALRRSRPAGTRRGVAIAGLVTSAIGLILGVLGLVLTVYLVRAIERFDDPGPHDATITSCTEDGSDVVATGEITNRSDRPRDYTVEVRLGFGDRDWVRVDDVEPGETATFTARELGTFRDERVRDRARARPGPVRPRPEHLRGVAGSARLSPAAVACIQASYSRAYVPPAVDQLVVGTVLDEAPVGEHEHPVGPGGRRQAVGDGDRGASLGEVRAGRGRCAPR